MAAQSASDLLLILYVLSAIAIKEGRFLAIFFLSDAMGYMAIFDVIPLPVRFTAYMMFYVCAYWLEVKINGRLKTANSYVIMILFQMVMIFDAIIYPEVETAIYVNYELLIMGIHIYIISTLIRWKHIRRSMGNAIDHAITIIRYNYNSTLLLLQ